MLILFYFSTKYVGNCFYFIAYFWHFFSSFSFYVSYIAQEQSPHLHRGRLFPHLERVHHGAREAVGVLAAREVESVHVAGVPPLVERGRRLVVLEAADDAAVYYYLEFEEIEVSSNVEIKQLVGVRSLLLPGIGRG